MPDSYITAQCWVVYVHVFKWSSQPISAFQSKLIQQVFGVLCMRKLLAKQPPPFFTPERNFTFAFSSVMHVMQKVHSGLS